MFRPTHHQVVPKIGTKASSPFPLVRCTQLGEQRAFPADWRVRVVCAPGGAVWQVGWGGEDWSRADEASVNARPRPANVGVRGCASNFAPRLAAPSTEICQTACVERARVAPRLAPAPRARAPVLGGVGKGGEGWMGLVRWGGVDRGGGVARALTL